MVNPIKFDEAGDSADLQALFDNIATGSPPTPPAPEPDPSGDSDDLQALFDTVAADASPASAPAAATESTLSPAGTQEEVFNRVGHLARKLHDSLRELGYDKQLQETAQQVPDAQERLNYIAKMTEQAASRVLNATDIAQPALDNIDQRTRALGTRWEGMFANQLSVEEFKALAADTRAFFAEAPTQIRTVNAQMTEIVTAQDFQDLTGQVIKKVIDMAQGFERQLLQLLLEVMPEDKKAAAPEGLMNGPVVNAAGRNDVVTSQEQVDDLLESLGF